MEILVLHNQSIFDIAIQHTGSVFNAFKIAVANGLAVSDILGPGNKLMIPGNIENNGDILNYYTAKKIQPATALVAGTIEAEKGIGWMQVGTNFKVR